MNGKMKFLYRRNSFLNNSLIQTHFDYASPAWYSNLNKALQKKLQITQNKCIRFCLRLDKKSHIGAEEFKNINWLPVNDRFNQTICSHVFKVFDKKYLSYMSDIFDNRSQRRTTRSSFKKLNQPCRKTNQGQRCQLVS